MGAARSVAGLAFLGLLVSLAGTARAETDLHLLGERFRVSATWRTADGATGTATAVPLTGETGLFWFFTPGNVELVVKVLDACAPPFERFWFYASGLTDVEVELTVQDTWTGQSKSYHRPRGTLFAPLADTSTFDGCGTVSACGQGTSAQIAATPRPDGEVEALALLLGPGATADSAIYDRLDHDLRRIRALRPSLAGVEFLYYWEPTDLLLSLEPDVYTAAKAGQFTGWDCLNAWYGVKRIDFIDIARLAVLRFEGRFHSNRILPDYTAVPGVEGAGANWYDYSIPGDTLSDLCAAIDGEAYDYFLYEGADQFRTWYFRVPQAGAAPVEFGNVSPTDPRPQWWPRFLQCRDNLDIAAGGPREGGPR